MVETSLRYPDFLIIGAMKSGTTTLYEDLRLHPQIGFSREKEPANLKEEAVLGEEGRRAYAELFRPVADLARIGDASPQYAMAPHNPGVPERARELLGPEARLVYILRDPIRRAISHHFHLFAHGACGPDFVAANRELRIFEDFGLYHDQLREWEAHYPREQILLVRFEDYVGDRAKHARRVADFVGAPPADFEPAPQAFNASGERRRPPAMQRALDRFPALDAVVGSGVWRRPVMQPVVRAAKRVFYRQPPKRPAVPPREELERLRERFEPQQQRLAADYGGDAPQWNLAETVERLSHR